MSDQTRLAALSDGPTSALLNSAGAVRSFATGGAVAPTEAQKEAGNYRKGHVRVHGMDLSIETPKGAKRSGKGKDGKPWSVTMPAHYGYIRGTKGADGDHVDTYLGPHPGNPNVHVVDQVDADTGKFDEHKALIGFQSRQHALDHYHRGFSDGRGKDRVGAVTTMPAHKFRSWVEKGRRTRPLGTLRVNRTNDDPYLAGESENHKCLYIDKRVPKQMIVKDKSFDPAKYLAVHESEERKHMDAGMKYEPAHRLALKAERAAVEADGIDWNGYQEQMHKLASITQKEKNPHPPRNLYKGPFPTKEQNKLTREGDTAPDIKKYAEGGEIEGDDEGISEDDAIAQGFTPVNQDVSQEDAIAQGFTPVNQEVQRPEYSVAGEALKRGAQAVLPGLGSIPGMIGGAELGTMVGGPIGTLAGAVVGGIASNVSLRKIQDWFMDKLGITPDPEQAAAFQAEHPNLATAADIAGSLVGMSPGGAAITGVQRAAMAGGQAAIEAGSEYLHTGELDPADIAMAAAAGAAFPSLNRVGEPLGQLGSRLAAKVGIRAGRPDMAKGGEPMKALPAPPDYTVSPEGEATPGGTDQVVAQAAAPRPGTPQENIRPIYEMPREDWEVTRPGTRPPDNTAPSAENDIPTKTDEGITADKSAATPGHAGYDPMSTLSTSHEMAPPRKDTNIGNPQSYPAGSERDYRTTTDSNVHPTSSGAGDHPTAETLDPTTGNISQELQQALTGEKVLYKGNINPTDKGGFGTSAGRNITADEALRLRAQEKPVQDNGPGRNTPPRGLKAADKRMQKSMRVPFEGEAANDNGETVPPPEPGGERINFSSAGATRKPLPELEARRGGEPTEEELNGVPPTPENVRSFPETNRDTQAAYQVGVADKEAGREYRQFTNPDMVAAYERGFGSKPETTGTVTKQPIGTEIPTRPETGIVEGAVADTAAKLRARDLGDVADAVEKNPAIEPQARKILQDLSAKIEEHGAVSPEEMKRVTRIMDKIEKKENPEEGAAQTRRESLQQQANLGEVTVAAESTKVARQKQFAAQAAQAAFDKFKPTSNKVPTTQVDQDLFKRRLTDALEFAKQENLGKDPLSPLPVKRTAAQEWLRTAQRFVNAKHITPKMISEFMSMETDARLGAKGAELRGANENQNLNQRIGEEAITAGENETASRGGVANTVEDEMVDRLDEHARLADNMKDLDHEHWLDENTATVKPPDSETSAAPTKNAANAHDEVGYHNVWEQEAADKAYKAAWQRFGRETLKNADPAKIATPEMIKNFFNDEKASLDYEKIKGALLARAKPINDWVVRNIMPEMFSQRAQYAEPFFAKRQVQNARLNEQFRDALDGEWYAFNNMSPYDQISFMTRYEQGKPQDAPWKDAVASRFKGMLDNAYNSEQIWGSQAEYVENYMSHIFENEADYNAYKENMFKRYGPTWFQKQRDFQTINDALTAGYKLKFTNPAEVVTRRLMASADMQLKMQLLHELNSMGLAYPIGDKSPNVTGTWQQIGAPNRENWTLAPDVQALWKNGVDAKGLWADERAVGSIFRGWMNLKNIWTPIKMSLSAFHPLHIAAGVLQADNFARGWTEGGFAGGLREMGKNIGDPLFAFGKVGGTFHPEFIGKQVREALNTPWEAKTPWQEETTRWADEGGFKGTMSHEEVISAQRDFAKAWNENDWTKWIPAAGRVAVEKAMGPIFSDWIPNLKMASYYRSAAAYMQAHPEAINDPDMRRIALRTIAKQVDNRYGEMFYGGLFWNRYAKDASIGSFLSLGWNLGFAREFGGAGISAVRGAAAPYVGPRNMAGRVVADASSKAAYVSSYAAITMGMAGIMSYALSGQLPTTPMDYVFPRAGGQNPDGSPRRLSTMFYTREPIQALAHMQERGSVAGGLGQMLWNKMVFEPVVEAYNNRDFFGYQLYDPQANWFKQWGQLAGRVLGDAFNPISMSSMERAQQTGGGARDKVLAASGFGPAPGYVSKDALQNRISHLYYQGPGAGEKPYENRARDQERRSALADLTTARKQGDTETEKNAQQRLIKAGVNPVTIARETRGSLDTYQFSRLDPTVQRELVGQMSDSQFFKYAMGNSPVRGKSRLALTQEWQRLHPGKPLPGR